MSTKRIVYDPNLGVAELVREALRGAGPLSVREIRRVLRERGQPYIRASSINKVLTGVLRDSVASCGRDAWALRSDAPDGPGGSP